MSSEVKSNVEKCIEILSKEVISKDEIIKCVDLLRSILGTIIHFDLKEVPGGKIKVADEIKKEYDEMVNGGLSKCVYELNDSNLTFSRLKVVIDTLIKVYEKDGKRIYDSKRANVNYYHLDPDYFNNTIEVRVKEFLNENSGFKECSDFIDRINRIECALNDHLYDSSPNKNEGYGDKYEDNEMPKTSPISSKKSSKYEDFKMDFGRLIDKYNLRGDADIQLFMKDFFKVINSVLKEK